MIGSYPPITGPALVLVGAMLAGNVTKVCWSDASEAIPVFLIILGIPLTFSIADGIALGLIAYPAVKLCGGKPREAHWIMYLLALLLVAYFFGRSWAG
jgi:AGZA family xanthine/uracil permease-like MFS transporter